MSRGVTSPERLGCIGGSNGGLLTGNMLTREGLALFGAIVCQVPLLDMRRYHKLLAGASWMEEYGDPDAPGVWEGHLASISPYERLRGAPCLGTDGAGAGALRVAAASPSFCNAVQPCNHAAAMLQPCPRAPSARPCAPRPQPHAEAPHARRRVGGLPARPLHHEYQGRPRAPWPRTQDGQGMMHMHMHARMAHHTMQMP